MASEKYALEPSVRAVLVDMGLSPANVLRRAGLPADLLAGASVWLNQDEFFSLWRSMEAELGDPNLPLMIEQAFSPASFSPTIFAAAMSPNLNLAASRIAKYKRLIGPARHTVAIDEDRTTITYQWPAGVEPPPTLVLSELLFWVEMARTGTRHRVTPLAVTAPEPPANVEAYRAYLGIEVTQSDIQSVSFSARDASRGFLIANEAFWDAFEPTLRQRLSELEVDAAASDRVRAVLLELLPVGRTTMAEVASELAMSTRTLHRRLKAESQTFQQILDSTREELARHYLSSPSLSAPEISFLLGYEETSSFYRAFQSWTGETPERVRASALAGD